jgi:hypothetical protein
MSRLVSRAVVLLDIEAQNSIAHTIGLSAIRFGRSISDVSRTRSKKKQEKKQAINYFTTHERTLIKINNVGVNDDRKHLADLHTCMKKDFSMLFMTFQDAVKYTVDYVERNGGTLASHCLVNDLVFLGKTQDHVGGQRIIHKNIEVDPKHGVLDPRWPKINLVCTRFLACTKANNFIKTYLSGCPPVTDSGKYYSTTLESFCRFIEGSEYTQSHSAGQDVEDLTQFVKTMVDSDGPEIFEETDQCIHWNPNDAYLPRVSSSSKKEVVKKRKHEEIVVVDPPPPGDDLPITARQIYGIRERLQQRTVPRELMRKDYSNMTKKEAWSYIKHLEQCPYK